MNLIVYPGDPYPLGATWDGEGVNFALFAQNATGVELCLYNNSTDKKAAARIHVRERSHYIWHIYIPGLKPGQLYGYRVHGPYDPSGGCRFNANKLLIDPYAKAIGGVIQWHDSLFGYEVGHPDGDLSFSTTNSAPYVPKSVVIDPHFDWENDKSPKIPYHRSIIYELHVKGFTKLHPEIPEEFRGTYSALGHPVTIKYLKQLGITAVELMPVHHFIIDRHLVQNNLTNYWGYNTIGFFAPDVRYSSSGIFGGQVNEFKQMVKELHKAGIEVILDVVYNHTGEGNHMGPTVTFRGIDNIAYYRLNENRRLYMDYTGTGNTLNAMEPNVLRLIMDSLRYWILEMHVDGFRFDLASALARELHAVDRLGSFLDIIHQDPVISQVKLIAEPWDVGEGGYQVGEFPPGWTEWNGKYRDCIRDYWRGANSMLAEFAERITGSSDLYKDNDRTPMASINFITAHDGFTLNDLVTFNEKRNEANKEDSRDGENHNRSWNCGEEGPTEKLEINSLRARQKRNFLTTLFLSQGVPMLLAGDEFSRTQNGNNNAYCQDNEISWINWKNADLSLLQFTQQLIEFSKIHPVFSRRRWFQGQPIKGIGLEDIAWFKPDGTEMTEENWKNDYAKSLAIYMNGRGIHASGWKGEQLIDDSFCVIFNAYHGDIEYRLPPEKYGLQWIKLFDTTEERGFIEHGNTYFASDLISVAGLSVVILIHPYMFETAGMDKSVEDAIHHVSAE